MSSHRDLAGGEGLYFGVKAALVSCCLVFGNDSLGDHFVDDRDSLLKRVLRCTGVAGIHRGEYLLDFGADE